MVEGLPCLLPLAGTNRATAVSRQSYYARTQLRELSTLLRPATHRITIAWSSLRVNSVHTSNGVRSPLKISDLFYISWRTTFFVCSIQRFGSSDDSHFRIDENNFKISQRIESGGGEKPSSSINRRGPAARSEVTLERFFIRFVVSIKRVSAWRYSPSILFFHPSFSKVILAFYRYACILYSWYSVIRLTFIQLQSLLKYIYICNR